LRKIAGPAESVSWERQQEYALLPDVLKAFLTDPAEGLLKKENAK
jgi:hypothetical protein